MRKLYKAKRIVQLSILFCFLLIPVKIKAQANVYVNPPTTILSGQTTVTIDVMISNVTNLHAYKVSLTFDNSILDFENVVKGPFLTSGGQSSAFFTTPSSVVDSINVEEAILGPYIVNGSGKLFSITFNVFSAGNSFINIADVVLKDLASLNIPVTWNSGEVVVPVSINSKIFLQGPFNTNVMSTNLNSSGYLPLDQPYVGFPWNYNGSESVPAGFFSTHSNIVDWILIELRTETGASTVVDRKAGFITNSGNIVGIDGVSLLYFTELAGNYYIVLYHRNHIPIMSSNSTYLDYVSTQYDFTNSQSKAYGTNSMKDLGGGYFGAYTGDSDGSGTVNVSDRSNTWNQRNLSGFYGTDVDLNGTVNAGDRSLIWNNRNISTQVPN